MKIEQDVIAPAFKIDDVFDRHIDLNDYRDKKVLVAFFRHAGCPFCNLRVHRLMKVQEELKELGLEMIFFFESKKHVLLRSTFHEEISPVPLISDPEKVWYDAYGLESSGYKSAMGHIRFFVQTTIKAKANGLPVHAMADGESIKTMPAEFLLDKGLVVKKLHYCQNLNDRMALDEIMDFARN